VTALEALRELSLALGRRASSVSDANRAARAERLRGHIDNFLLPRARDASAPLILVLLGSTGSGKSSLFNALAGRDLSPSGILRPTTRRPVVLTHPDDADADLLPGLASRDAVEVIADPGLGRGLVLVDAPDFDSVELANRALAIELLEAADVVVFVTTATRYADEVPWTILQRARERGVPLLTVMNRLPNDDDDTAAILVDYAAMLDRAELVDAGALGPLEVVPVAEGSLEPERDALAVEAVAAIREALARLTADATERRKLAERSLSGALAGLPDAIDDVAREVDEEHAAATALLAVAEHAYRERRRDLGQELGHGTFLRAEVLRQWQDFVGSGQVARFLTTGIGRIGAAVRSVFRPGPQAPAIEVREAAFADLVALVIQHADAAARQTAVTWLDDRFGEVALAQHGRLWGASPDLGDRLRRDLARWTVEIGEQIRLLGEQRQGWAKAASLGVNAAGTSLILAVFLHTGGLTGTEVGIAAGTAVVNQKILEAIFGEANVAAFVSRARDGLGVILDGVFDDERERYVATLGTVTAERESGDHLRQLAQRASVVAAT
jgi:energy-coupling factor transporter ATP-binding protein EcfA2